ncbi:MAG TPA: uracil-DNA glycosylase [Kiritimatiellia bacterium]|nr:uracil-DNA glycosylase [Kiritimatiellia bacterium]
MTASGRGQTMDVFDALTDYVQQLALDGVTEVEVAPETLAKLRGVTIATPAAAKPAGYAGEVSRHRSPPASLPPASSGKDLEEELAGVGTLEEIAARVAGCRRCGLCKERNKTVPGQGNVRPRLMFVGEGPGAEEDAQGLAFVGRAGRLLTDIIEAMGLKREEVFIGNIVKCRPPGNRVPTPEEMAACIPYLKRQIALLKPEVIVALGATAMKGLFGDTLPGITKVRGTWQRYESIAVMPTFHPAYLLRNPPAKKFTWVDMKLVLTRLGLPIPEPKKPSS